MQTGAGSNSASQTQTINKANLNSAQQEGSTSKTQASGQGQQEKVLITGDDILIEYVDRLMNQLKVMGDENLLQDQWKKAIEKFITHYVWHSQDRRKVDGPMIGIIERLEGRLHEMQERRRRLIKYLYKKEGKLEEFEEGFHQSISKKSTIIKKFSSIQLEDLLRTSTKNVAQEVVSSLIPPQGGLGVLAQVEKFCQVNNIQSPATSTTAASNQGAPSSSSQPPRTQFEGGAMNQNNQGSGQLAGRNMVSSGHIGQHQNPQSQAITGGHNSVPKQRLKSATMMNKRIQRGAGGFQREDDGQYDEGNNHQQYHGYTGHLSNTGMPAVGGASSYTASGQGLSNTRQSKTSSGARNQSWKNQQQIY